MIGYYVHHVGQGHLQRARVLAGELAARHERVTVLSSLPRPADWVGHGMDDWVDLPRDDEGAALRPTAGGRLHWAPLGDAGLRERSARISSWIARSRPDAMVVDVSVEVALLARLHGVRVVATVLPGGRGDEAHRLGFDVADELVAFWPPHADGMLHGVSPEVTERLHRVGALSRFPVTDEARPGPGRRVLVMLGRGGADISAADLARAASRTPHWSWTLAGGDLGPWVDDLRPALAAADVVVTHAGQNALAEVASARRPAVVVPQRRPHDEQATTAAVLRRGGWPAVVCETWPDSGWEALLDTALSLDGAGWSSWCDGAAARRFADVVTGALVEPGVTS